MYQRLIELEKNPEESFFLWGPRKTGKTTLLKFLYPEAPYVDLLKTDILVRYTNSPWLFREELLAYPTEPSIAIIDEVQKIPALLDEVHWLIENTSIKFILCGSSARKVKRGHANMLGGRALRYELFGLSAAEIGEDFDLERLLNRGSIPGHYNHNNAKQIIRSYIYNYLREEISAEGLVRNLPTFSRFLDVVAIADTEIVKYSNIANDCQVASSTVKDYYNILVDTLLGRFLPAYRKQSKRKLTASPKFYLFDIGVVNSLSGRGELKPGNSDFGKAFENWIFHELLTYSEYSQTHYNLSYWRLLSGSEVDFIIGDMELAIEAKAVERVNSSHLKGLRELQKDNPEIKQRVIVSLDKAPRLTSEGVLVLPYREFVARLWRGELV